MNLQTQLIPSRDGFKIWAQAVGDLTKPAVVFIHGFGCSSSIFEKQFASADMLRDLYMIRYDVRGHGRSDQPLEAESYESIHHAEDFKAVCDAFGVFKPFTAGWSLGGIVAADALAAYGPDIIAGSILLGAMPWRSMHPEIAHPVVMGLVPGLISLDRDSLYQTAKDFVSSCVAEGFEIPTKDFFDMVLNLAVQNPLVRLHSLTRTQDETAILAVTDTLPVLSVHGVEDRHMYVDKLEVFMKSHFVKVEFIRLAGAGHAPFYEKPEVVNKFILEFVSRVSAESKASIKAPLEAN